jgi:hypothetical protein
MAKVKRAKDSVDDRDTILVIGLHSGARNGNSSVVSTEQLGLKLNVTTGVSQWFQRAKPPASAVRPIPRS